MKKYPRPEMQIQVLNKEQLKVLLRAASQDNWYLEILLATFAGLRKGEILGLKFQDFDLENQTEEVKKELIDKAICKINAKEAFKKEMEAKIAEMETKWQNISSLSLEEQKEVIDWKMGKRCCKKQKCDKAPAHPCK